jgi:N6-adenosine-specific RNA methylase IME4
MSDEAFTKIAGNLLVNVRDLVGWGIEGGHTTPEQMRLTVTARKEAAVKLIEGGMSQRAVAKVLGVSHQTIMRDMVRDGPENGPKSATGSAVTHDSSVLTGALEDATRAGNAALKLVEPAPVLARYGTIIIDPPWEMEKIERVVRPNQTPSTDYPTMTEDELSNFPVEEMAGENCHLFCWTIQKHLPSALRLVAVWGFKYVLLMTWYKPGGFQPFGLPQYNSEFVVYARRGAPKFRDTQAFGACFQGERREHSRKPDVFYDTVRRVTADGRIDVFSREARDGFDQHGNEAGKFAHG